jgi:mannose-6-phosphate isomerase-like protein (cupin superfamily)
MDNEKYRIVECGPVGTWGEHYGGFSPESSYYGRHVLEKEMPFEYVGVTVNSREPGEGVDFWHSHAVLEELYFFVEGEGEMGLDDEVVPVKAGTALLVKQGVMRTWRANPTSPGPLRWLCIRAGGDRLANLSGEHSDATKVDFSERPSPW